MKKISSTVNQRDKYIDKEKKHDILSLVPVQYHVIYHTELGQFCSQPINLKPESLTTLLHKHRCWNIRCYISEIAFNKMKAKLCISAVHETQWKKVLLIKNNVKLQTPSQSQI